MTIKPDRFGPLWHGQVTHEASRPTSEVGDTRNIVRVVIDEGTTWTRA